MIRKHGDGINALGGAEPGNGKGEIHADVQNSHMFPQGSGFFVKTMGLKIADRCIQGGGWC